jgi:hypothetical protein
MSFPTPTEMFQFGAFASQDLWIESWDKGFVIPWVAPFGNLRVKWPCAPNRSLSQLITSFFADGCQGIPHVPLSASKIVVSLQGLVRKEVLPSLRPACTQHKIIGKPLRAFLSRGLASSSSIAARTTLGACYKKMSSSLQYKGKGLYSTFIDAFDFLPEKERRPRRGGQPSKIHGLRRVQSLLERKMRSKRSESG